MALAITVSGNLDPFALVALAGMALCAAGAYWLGNRKWMLVPVVAMLVEITIAIPVSLRDPLAVETAFSIVREAPFWTGIPAFVGAAVGYGIRRLRS